MVLTSDHISPATGKTVTVNIAKAGNAFGAPSGGATATEMSVGWYKIALSATDTNTLGDLSFDCTAAGADNTDFVDQVFANILGDTLPANVLQWNTSNVAVPATAGIPDINVKNIVNVAAAVDANNLLKVDTEDWKGTAVSAPATAGIPDVNVKNMNNVSGASITTVNANQGTTQPVNFTGVAGAALVKVDVTDIATAAVSPTTAQLGVNVVQINTVSAASVTTINANQGTTQPINFTGVAGAALVKSDVTDIAGAAVNTAAAQLGVNVVNIAGQAAALDINNLLKVDVEDWKAGVVPAVNVTGVPKVDVVDWLGVAPLALSAQQVQAVVPAATIVASVTGAVGSVTGNVGGDVSGKVLGNGASALVAVAVQADVEQWKTAAPNALIAGRVDANAQVVGDKTGYSLTQAFPANFAATSIDASGNVKIQANVKKNTALAKFEFLITDNVNHVPATGALALTPTRSIDGGAFAAGTLSVVTELSNGIYSVDFGAGDLNGNVITLRVTSTNNDDVFATLVTAP
jgi:hypothetical protein